MSTPDKKRVAENLDSRINWKSVSINSCFLGWRGNPGQGRSSECEAQTPAENDVRARRATAVE
jgi:hypothetical protein